MGSKILIVDDDPHILNLLQSALKSKGYETKGLATGHEALDFIKSGSEIDSYNLLILDRILPDMEGSEILSVLRNELKKNVPVLILSSLSGEKDVLGGLEKGATDYITKPFNIDILLQKVSSIIK